ncbi:MAG: T9SS type A sorting domain-containing protein [Saprospiraceae bacterium]|nr:T9SS type A sorting domain-containing protein [Saprospiraceae bacterium]
MKTKTLTTLIIGLLFLSPQWSNAQDWEKTFVDSFGLSKGFALLETSDQGYVIAGEIDLPTGALRHHIWMVKTDLDGNELWSKIYDYYNIGYRSARAIAETVDQDLLLVGSDGFSKALVFKTASNGDSLWTKGFGGNGVNSFYDIVGTDDNNFILVGSFEAETGGNGNTEIWAMGMNAAGDSLWSKKYFAPATFNSAAMDISPLPSGNYLISGKINGQGFALEILGTDGTEIWSNTYNLSTEDIFLTSALNTNTGNILLGGTASGIAGYSPSLIEINQSGGFLNPVPFVPSDFGVITAMAATSDNGFILTGSSYDFWNQNGNEVGFISKLDNNLNTEWEIIYSDSLTIQGAAIRQNTDGSYLIAGSREGGMFLKKIAGSINATSSINTSEFSANVFPNPATDKLCIEIPPQQLQTDLAIRFYSVDGKLINQYSIDNPSEYIQLSAFPKGFYTYVIFHGQKELISGKLVIH